jgi:hypothetical protein
MSACPSSAVIRCRQATSASKPPCGTRTSQTVRPTHNPSGDRTRLRATGKSATANAEECTSPR